MIHWTSQNPPAVPFFASIFNYYLSDDLAGYEEYDKITLDLVQSVPGYLGYESMKHNGRGTFISYWANKESILEWAKHPVHVEAKKLGAMKWYKYYHSMIAEVNTYHEQRIIREYE